MTEQTPRVDLSNLEISEVRSKKCVDGFRCGEREIDVWASDKAYRFHEQDRARVFCARLSGQSYVIGFYSLSLNQIGAKYLFGQHADRYSSSGHAPFIYVDWFAVSKNYQSRGIGKIMMVDALKRACKVSFNIPFYGVALRSMNDKTTLFYEKLGFVKREQGRHPVMILPIWTIRDLFQGPKP